MFDWFREIDRLLRGAHTGREVLESGEIGVPVRKLVVAGFVLGSIYGACMGLFAVVSSGSTGSMGIAQLFATTIKVPLLFLLTLVVTFPSLYVFSALSNSRLGAADTLKLLHSVLRHLQVTFQLPLHLLNISTVLLLTLKVVLKLKFPSKLL